VQTQTVVFLNVKKLKPTKPTTKRLNDLAVFFREKYQSKHFPYKSKKAKT